MEKVIAFVAICVVAAVWICREVGKTNQQRSCDEHGPVGKELICPHCQAQGHVHTKSVQQKKGISGGKATAALLTGGVSMLATGLSRNEQATEAYCGNCKSKWTF